MLSQNSWRQFCVIFSIGVGTALALNDCTIKKSFVLMFECLLMQIYFLLCHISFWWNV